MKISILAACGFAFCSAVLTVVPASAQWQHKLQGPTSLAFSPDGKTLATGNIEDWLAPGDLRLWRVSDGKLLHKTRYVYSVDGVAFSPDGKTLAMTTVVEKSKNPIRLWDVAAWRTKRVLGDDQFLSSIDYSRDGKRLVVGSNIAETGETVFAYVWNIAKKQNRALPQSDGFAQMLWSPNGIILGAFPNEYGYGKDSLRTWNTDGKLLWKQPQPDLNDMALMPGNKTFLAAIGKRKINSKGDVGAVQLRELATGKVKYSLKQSVPALVIAVSRDGKMWASGAEDGSVRLWNAQTRRFTRMLKPHRSAISNLQFSPDGRYLASASRGEDDAHDSSIRLTQLN